MKRYLLFGHDYQEPAGGWNDYINDFNTVHSARHAAENYESLCDYAFHIVDSEKRLVTWERQSAWVCPALTWEKV